MIKGTPEPFRAFLNIAMLITESERARLLRQTILDIVIDTINQRTGGATKYINQRDEDFICRRPFYPGNGKHQLSCGRRVD